MKTIEAGKLRERVTLAKRVETNPDAPDDYGNTVGEWQDQGEVWAEFVFRHSGEAVIAGRLQGRNTLLVRVRTSPLTRQVSSEWKVTDARTGTEYAVAGPPEVYPAVVEILCQSGVAV
ncbi:phage head closure protein [Thauera sp.]|uniref:phage head closure protein n=1 Tax=Thauera sp. TaxID=1905334 RepID=UPI002B9D03AF|nr:phage head closure protein [Thauera sp.]HRP26022.1 phage head closure protein [Thauera sp.]